MPFSHLAIVLLTGLILGSLIGIMLRARGGGLLVLVLLGIVGAMIGALLPALIGNVNLVDVSGPQFLLRAVLGSALLMTLATLFRASGRLSSNKGRSSRHRSSRRTAR